MTRAGVPVAGADLRLRGRTFGPERPLVMAVVNRTPDSFYPAARFDDSGADAAVARAAEEGADLVDLGGVRAGRGPRVDVAEEIARVIPLVERVRARHPDLLVSVDTWRAEVARAAARAGADLINDTWAGHDPALVEVAAEHGVGVVCSHTGGAAPRTDPLRVAYGAAGDHAPGADPLDGVVDDVVATLRAAAARAVSLGVDPASVLVDPTHDFGKNTWHSLHLVRRTEAVVALGHPTLMAFSRKDFVGESLGLPVEERLEGTLAATSVAAWLGARVFRAHDVLATRRVLDMVATIRGDLAPARAVRGLA
ncbi:dihydropteroate synthase [Cellulomonas chengniuliangii]|uniref:Dihydropteroate synthase n=1 Tax=Cellulomonas chengniuliangii TaxID=2968084 RepID=A0ABY5L3M8_9CELL|nr:dihydropteroate synthase [Cellulomonas chengniuliangii]MCC2307034.1 dihydropteroate synthase [Cellulomonas chengniuliangii]MCC2316417.1 dihydropteroate synthase [Cellulomonas chengniuliangii]UUI76162.1 dihydropteroate synthase [Cellulomonas chengniuliangii]